MIVVIAPFNIYSETIQQIIDKVETVSEKREALEVEVDAYAAQIKFLEERIALTNEQIAATESRISENQELLIIEQEKLSEYLRVIYENGQTSFLEKVFNSDSLTDFMDQDVYLDSARNSLKESSDKLARIRDELNAAQRELGELIVQNELARATLEKQRAAKDAELTTVTEEERNLREKFALRLTKIGGSSPYCKTDGQVIKSKYSLFSFPTDCGYISQGFGKTEYATIDNGYNGSIHNGADVAVNTGTPIKSIGNGEVFAKGISPSGGWGNWVMVKQDKVIIDGSEVEFYALYAHMVLETHLKVGDKIPTGTVVGFSGGTPNWAPHLHLSLFVSNSNWADGQPGPYPGNVVDPLDYIDIPISTVGTDWDLRHAH